MEFLVILTAWALLYWLGPGARLHHDRWLAYWYQRAGDALSALPLPLRLLAIAALPCVVLQLVAWLLAPWLAGTLLFLLLLATLLYSLGRGDFGAALDAYLERWRRGDYEAAYRELEDPVGLIHTAATDAQQAAATVEDRAGLHAEVRGALLYAGFERWFAVVFWFFLLGPAVALFYRLLQLLARLPQISAAESALLLRWIEWLEWLPVRLLGLAFAIAGNFVGCFRAWRTTLAVHLSPRALLVAYADQALMPDGAGREPGWEQRAADELVALRELLARAAIVWLVVFALVQLVF